MSGSRDSRLIRDTDDQKMLVGIQQYLSKVPAITVGAQSLAPADLVTILQERIASSQAVQTATAARSAAVKADRDKRTQTAPAVKALKRVVQGMFPGSPDILAVFGLQPLKVGTRTVATKAAAVEQTLATRKARHTMGAKQKEGIKGTPPSASTGSEATPAPVTEPVVTPAPVPPAPVVTTPIPVKTGPTT
jgi:hypothetical protein